MSGSAMLGRLPEGPLADLCAVLLATVTVRCDGDVGAASRRMLARLAHPVMVEAEDGHELHTTIGGWFAANCAALPLDDAEAILALRPGASHAIAPNADGECWTFRITRGRARYQVDTYDGDADLVTWAEFAQDNADDADTLDAVSDLVAVGDSVTLGGGATPVVTVTRVSW